MHTLIEELTEVNKHLQQEVVELKQKEARLEKSVSLLRSILASTAYGIIAVSLEEDIVSCNQQFVQMWQIPNSLTISRNSFQCQAFFENQLKEPQLFRDSMWEMKCDCQSDRYDILELKDGRCFAQYSRPQRLDSKIIGRVWSIWDISELSQALEQSKQLGELRAQFLSMLSHQLRTPLNVISFSNSLLKRHIKEWTEEKTRPLLDRIQTSVEQISKMLDDILFLAKAEAAKLHFEAKPLNLVRLCDEIVAQIHTYSSQNRINFVSPACCFTAFIDKKLLEPILKNLLDNAIKYSPSGAEVDFQLSWEQETVIFQVTDSGIGIPAADQQRLFEPFYRGSNIANLPGTGLGLSIVKTLVDLHGGHIDMKSEVGVGTTVTIMLPFVK
ncbi:PAS domain-containing sensor histidine kinase [Nostoc sp. LEGE 06077]|uniref:PAS domain-containing sensor histidine kinase n=1 Tax=Nostoc sp. LEGE 06077 TaxID=915325 RepID=UPI0018811685|nr:PAS domain-containing sensor histidine kinase [Nostoc sp. LEGE 06077]MBE9207489.1 PAS domain-containing sensor histidine kinase [Nostoc sp. LEGE 06077]